MRKPLNQSCLRDIFSWLQKDPATLHHCCLVHSDWLQAGARVLYSDPYQYFTPFFEQTQQLRALLLFQTLLESSFKAKENSDTHNTKEEPLLNYLGLLRSVDLTWFKRLLLINCWEENQQVLHQDVIKRVFQVYLEPIAVLKHLVYTQVFQLEVLFQDRKILNSLTSLEICWRSLDARMANEFLKVISHNCQQLVSLTINANNSSSLGLQGVNEILSKQTYGTLKHLGLKKFQFRPQQFKEVIDALVRGPRESLLSLGLEQCSLFPGTTVERVDRLPNLHTLELGFCYGLCDSHLVSLAKCCEHLRHLNLSHTSITIVSIRVIIERLGRQLQRLDISYPYRVDHSLDSCIPLLSQNSPNLVHLNIKGIRYGYPAIDELIGSCAKLRSLSLGTPYRQEPNIADRLLARILTKCARLKELELGNTKITVNGLNTLSRYIAKLEEVGEILCVGLDQATVEQSYPELNIDSLAFWEEDDEPVEGMESEVEALVLPPNFLKP